MERDFYRGIRERRWFSTSVRRLTRNRRRLFFVILALALVLYLLFDNKGIITRLRLESQKKELIQKVEEAEKEAVRLQERQKAIQGDKQTIEKIARERHGMAREGETLYRIKQE